MKFICQKFASFQLYKSEWKTKRLVFDASGSPKGEVSDAEASEGLQTSYKMEKNNLSKELQRIKDGKLPDQLKNADAKTVDFWKARAAKYYDTVNSEELTLSDEKSENKAKVVMDKKNQIIKLRREFLLPANEAEKEEQRYLGAHSAFRKELNGSMVGNFEGTAYTSATGWRTTSTFDEGIKVQSDNKIQARAKQFSPELDALDASQASVHDKFVQLQALIQRYRGQIAADLAAVAPSRVVAAPAGAPKAGGEGEVGKAPDKKDTAKETQDRETALKDYKKLRDEFLAALKRVISDKKTTGEDKKKAEEALAVVQTTLDPDDHSKPVDVKNIVRDKETLQALKQVNEVILKKGEASDDEEDTDKNEDDEEDTGQLPYVLNHLKNGEQGEYTFEKLRFALKKENGKVTVILHPFQPNPPEYVLREAGKALYQPNVGFEERPSLEDIKPATFERTIRFTVDDSDWRVTQKIKPMAPKDAPDKDKYEYTYTVENKGQRLVDKEKYYQNIVDTALRLEQRKKEGGNN